MRTTRPARGLLLAAVLLLEAVTLGAVAYAGRDLPMAGIAVRSGAASITVSTQTAVVDAIAVANVVSPSDAWIVVQPLDAGGRAGMPIGVQRVPAGRSANVRVAVKAMGALPPLVLVSLFADRGASGVFEADMTRMAASVDKPFITGGRAVSVRTRIEQYGVAVSMDQAMLDSPRRLRRGGDVRVARVVVPEPSWVVITLGGPDAAPGVVVGATRVSSGETTNVVVPLAGAEPGVQLTAALYADRGTPRTLDRDPADPARGADEPYLADGMPVVETVLMPY